ncbi:MAG: Bacterial self-protective colicin-like immunity [Nocardioides sp.]|jgi:hypothetical protein|nr:Bacterial self-protective colicin-like immunity [Nocardioides sp.]
MNDDEWQNLSPLLDLIGSFVAGELGPEAFEREFLHSYKDDPYVWSEATFSVLDELFAEVESDLDPDELREAANEALKALRSL